MSKVFPKYHIPTTPNTFLISGTKMASVSTAHRMVRVAAMWMSQEKARPPKSSKMAALRACGGHTDNARSSRKRLEGDGS